MGVAAVLGVAGSVISGIGAQQAANANAAAEERQGQLAAEAARSNAAKASTDKRRLMGSLRASYGGAGVGLAEDVIADAAASEQLNIETIRWEGSEKAKTHYSNAQRMREQGRMQMVTSIFTGAVRGFSGGLGLA